MSTSKHIDKICCVIVALTLVVSFFSVGFGAFGELGSVESGYELKLFDDSYVHNIDIVMDDWESFIETCENEEYATCSLIIDGDAQKNVAIRAKGNTSLSSVSAYGNDRYSFKVEFDHYDNSFYYGLDKLSLNNLIQDNTYMKDYLVYTMMRRQGAAAPLCSFVNITVNGEPWGLYLAVEGVEDSFLTRNYGSDYGTLYKPDSTSMGGGRGNGRDFQENDFQAFTAETENSATEGSADAVVQQPSRGGEVSFQAPSDESGVIEMPELPTDENLNVQIPENAKEFGNMKKPDGMGGGMSSSSDVLLQYTDNNYTSYSNIFDNAKTDITDNDKDRLINSLKLLNEGENIESCVDVEQVVRYFTVHNFVCNFDSYTGQMIHNYYLYEKDGLLSMLPWDYNLAFGGFMSGSDAESLVNFPIDSPVSGGDAADRPMIAWVFANEEYTELYHKCFNELITNLFDSGWFEEKFTSVSQMIAPYVENDPTSFCTYDEFTAGVDALKEFCLLRAQSVKGQLDGTIPATSVAQAKDKTAFIKTGNLNINAMGSMGKGMGGDRGDMGGNKNFIQNDDQAINTSETPQQITEPTAQIQPETTTQTVTESMDSTAVQPGGFMQGQTPPDGMPQGEMPQGGMPQGEMPQGEMPQGGMPQGEMPGGGRGGFRGDAGKQFFDGEPQVTQQVSEAVTVQTYADESNQGKEAVSQPDSQNNISQDTDGQANRTDKAFGEGDMNPGVGMQPSRNGISTEYIVTVIASVVLLALALVFALLFKRYRRY